MFIESFFMINYVFFNYSLLAKVAIVPLSNIGISLLYRRPCPVPNTLPCSTRAFISLKPEYKLCCFILKCLSVCLTSVFESIIWKIWILTYILYLHATPYERLSPSRNIVELMLFFLEMFGLCFIFLYTFSIVKCFLLIHNSYVKSSFDYTGTDEICMFEEILFDNLPCLEGIMTSATFHSKGSNFFNVAILRLALL